MSRYERLLSLTYWVEGHPGPLQPLGRALCLALAALFALHLLWRLATWRRRPATLPMALGLLASMSGLGATALRLTSSPICAARIWTAAPLALLAALLTFETWLQPEWSLLGKGWSALWTCRPVALAPSPEATAALLALHLCGLTLVGRLLAWPAWAAPGLLLALMAPAGAAGLRRARYSGSLASLNALLPAYLLAGLDVARRLVARGGGPSLPLGPLLALLLAYALAYQVYTLCPAGWRGALRLAPAFLVGGAALAWAGRAYLALYARGVTASDPYCYVQMAVDVMRHGTPLHRFPLVELARPLGLDLRPLLHVGYRQPVDALGWAPTVWPVGHALLLGLLGRLGGEPAIYLATPLSALASIAATIWLAVALFHDLERPWRWLAAGLAGFLVATSFEQLRWLLVHMADISTQLFSTLTVLLAWLAAQRGRRACALLAGLALALAYWTRHTQLAMAVPALAALAWAGCGRPHRARLGDAALFLAAALVAALPDLAYHHVLFGSPLHPESEELALYALRAIPATTLLLVRGWLAAPEFGWLAPLLAGGAVALWRRSRAAAGVLALWLVALWAVQAPYASLRLRDLLPALPVLAVIAAYGAVRALAWLAPRRRDAAVLCALALVALLWLRTGGTAAIPRQRSFDNFGFLWASQRAEFAALHAVTEPDAVVGSTLNGGPVDLYGGRQAFRPAAWSASERQRFLGALWATGRPVYLLADGVAMEQVLIDMAGVARLTPVHTLRQIPCFTLDAGSSLRDAVLYRVEPLAR